MATDIPGASVYATAVEMAKARYQTRLADLNKQRQSTLRTAGFTGTVDPTTGLVKNQRVDPYNQYGQYQQLNRAQALQGQEIVGQNIARRLGAGGGLAAQNLNNARYDWGQQDSSFGANLLDQLGAFDRQQQDELYQYNQALYESQQKAAQSAISAGDYGAPDGGSSGSVGYNYTTPVSPIIPMNQSGYYDVNALRGTPAGSAIKAPLPPVYTAPLVNTSVYDPTVLRVVQQPVVQRPAVRQTSSRVMYY